MAVRVYQPGERLNDLHSIAESIKAEMVTLNTHQKGMSEAACRIGRHLIEARKELAVEDTFKEWVAVHCGFSYQSACRYVRLAENWGTYTEYQRAKLGLANLLDLVKGKGRGRKKSARGRRGPVTTKRLTTLALQFKIVGDVEAFVRALGVRVIEEKAKPAKAA